MKKNNTDILEKLAQSEGFLNFENFQFDAAWMRISRLYDSCAIFPLNHPNYENLAEQIAQNIAQNIVKPVKTFGDCEWGYEIYPDASLYVRTNGGDEVWFHYQDFYREHLLDYFEGNIKGELTGADMEFALFCNN